MKCLQASGKGPFTWDIRISCESKHTKYNVYKGLEVQGGFWRLHNQIRNFALVTCRSFHKDTDFDMDIFFIVTTEKDITNPPEHWKSKFKNTMCTLSNDHSEPLSKHATVAHVHYFSRLSVRRFCWFYAASEEEVEEMPNDQLLAIMPGAAAVLEGNEHLAPKLWAIKNSASQLLSIKDCSHKWWSNPNTYKYDTYPGVENCKEICVVKGLCEDYKKKHPEHGASLDLGIWPGPCMHCGSEESRYGFNYCSGCYTMICTICLHADNTHQEEKLLLEEANKAIEKEAIYNEAYEYVRYKSFNMKEVYVSTITKMRNDAKIEWLTLELSGQGSCLAEFAEKFVQLFSASLTKKAQKSTCLELYRSYADIEHANIEGEYGSVEEYRRLAYSNGINIPADEIQGFEETWDPNAPARCFGCKAPLPRESKTTKCAGCMEKMIKKYKATCKQPVGSSSNDAMVCGGEVESINGCFVCLTCGHGAAHAKEILPAVGVVQKMQDAANMLHNFFEFNNEEILEEERQETLKRKRL